MIIYSLHCAMFIKLFNKIIWNQFQDGKQANNAQQIALMAIVSLEEQNHQYDQISYIFIMHGITRLKNTQFAHYQEEKNILQFDIFDDLSILHLLIKIVILVILFITATHQVNTNCSIVSRTYTVDPAANNIHFKIKTTSLFLSSYSTTYSPYTWLSNISIPELNCTTTVVSIMTTPSSYTVYTMEAGMICNISWPLEVDINFTIVGYTNITSTPSFGDSANSICTGYAYFSSNKNTPPPNPPTPSNDSQQKTVLIIGIVNMSILVLVILALVIIYCKIIRNRQKPSLLTQNQNYQ